MIYQQMAESEIIKCPGCHATKLASFYSIRKNTGQRYKCCEDCRARRRVVSEKNLRCPQCDYKANFESQIKCHVDIVHKRLKNFACLQCEFKCFCESMLRKHVIRVHEKQINHRCPTCDYGCFVLRDLQTHMKAVHDRIKDLQCPNCDYRCSHQIERHRCRGRERMSAGEFAIKGVLDAYNIPIEQERRFHDCRDQNALPFDFYIPSLNAAIEFDGIQHFQPIDLFGGQAGFEGTQRRDAIKTEYCAANGIRLLRIKYTDFALIPTLIENFLSSVEESAVDGNHDTINATSNEIGGIEPIQAQNPDLPQ